MHISGCLAVPSEVCLDDVVQHTWKPFLPEQKMDQWLLKPRTEYKWV